MMALAVVYAFAMNRYSRKAGTRSKLRGKLSLLSIGYGFRPAKHAFERQLRESSRRKAASLI